jgi:deoxycytidylate deaminase
MKQSLEYYIKCATEEACKSTMEHRHGCVIINKGKVIVRSYNYRIYFYSHGFSIHAEVNAIRKLKNMKISPKECSMVIVRLEKSGLRNSKPCSKCEPEIRNAGFNRVYYSI